MTPVNSTERLRDIVLLAQREQGVSSGRQLADRAKAMHLGLSHTTVNRILSGTYKSRLDAPTITALARLARVSTDRVRAAAGLPPEQPPFASDLPPDVDQLGPRERAAVVQVIRVMLELRHGTTTSEADEASAIAADHARYAAAANAVADSVLGDTSPDEPLPHVGGRG